MSAQGKAPMDPTSAKTIPGSVLYGSAVRDETDVQDNAYDISSQWASTGPYDEGASVRGQATKATVDSPGGRNLGNTRVANSDFTGAPEPNDGDQ